jgi:hypothetical protein
MGLLRIGGFPRIEKTLAPAGRESTPGGDAQPASDFLLFGDAHASLRIERGADDTFERVLGVHGEEVTAYDLTPETVTAIGRKLLSAAACA